MHLNGSHYLLAAFSTKSPSSTYTELLACKINQNDVEEVSRKDISEYCYGVMLQVTYESVTPFSEFRNAKLLLYVGYIPNERNKAESLTVSKQNRAIQ